MMSFRDVGVIEFKSVISLRSKPIEIMHKLFKFVKITLERNGCICIYDIYI